MANHNNPKLHIAMLPWLAFGHIIPFLELAKLLASKGHTVSFISTPRNIDRLPQIPQTLTTFINFIKVNLPTVKHLPNNAESTKDLPYDKVKYLKLACDKLRTPVEKFIKNSSLDWIICDFVMYWIGPMAAEHNVRSAYFSVFPAVSLGFVGSPEVLIHGSKNEVDEEEDEKDRDIIIRRPKWVKFETEVRPSRYQLMRSFESFHDGEVNVSDTYRLGATINGCDAVFVRSGTGFEPEWLNLLKELYEKPVIPTGVLPSSVADSIRAVSENVKWEETKKWLDKHEKGTVVYIGFGTETKPSQYELTQLALGLELCGLPFYWVLIDQRGVSDDEVIELPCGFEERTRGRGVVCREWAPQFKILSHDSVGGLLIHSGMSSVVEGFQLGKPLVLIPFLFDQGLIASYLVEKKMAFMIDRDEVDGSFTPESVADSVILVMVKEEGKMYREKAKEMMSLFSDRDVQDKCVDDLIHFLQNK